MGMGCEQSIPNPPFFIFPCWFQVLTACHRIYMHMLIGCMGCAEREKKKDRQNFVFLFSPYPQDPSMVIKWVCLLIHTHTNPWGRLKLSYAITRLTAHFMCGLMSGLVICKFGKIMVMHDTECLYWDQVSLNNTNQTKPTLRWMLTHTNQFNTNPWGRLSDHLQTPGWQPTSHVAWCLIWSYMTPNALTETKCH